MYGGGGQYDAGGGQYDGNGGAASANNLFGGGGFMPSQTTNTPEGGGGGGFNKGRGSQTLMPLTVKQLMDASQTNDDKSSFAVNGWEVSTVRLVGRMLNKNERVTDVTFVLDDGTGRIEVNRWENETSDTEEMKLVNDGDYVIVNGGLKGFQGKRHVVAYSVRLVTNYNDITHHFLYCIYVHLDLAKAKRLASQPQANASTSTWNQAPLPNNQSASGNTAGKELTDLVMSVFHDPVLGNMEHGVSVDEVASRLKLSDAVARSTVQHLADIGNLYPTIDDNHFKSALNG
ncbi:replication protein A 32 kDa subunit B [Lolium perenne]|uniref:replication protein A 32 kDa subunit B n=1 Tax=Lolium perenne TaxID=4522 RepID=UPI0021EA5D12|nr:replication protein A 32 kDa subunit B-like [Lolium perenne]